MSSQNQLDHWVVSVISTYEDLRDLRSAISTHLKDLGFAMQLFEEPGFPVEAKTRAHEACLFAVNRADIVILIVDKRYGGLFLGEGPYSITEEEYHEAVKANKVLIPCVRKAAWDDHKALTAARAQEVEQGRSHQQALNAWSPRYIEGREVSEFLTRVTCAPHDDFLVLFETVPDLLKLIEGRVSGLSRTLCRWIVRRQVDEVLSQKTTTALAFSLGDILQKGYFVDPPYEPLSGAVLPGIAAEQVLLASLASNRSVLVLGEPGSGKSTILAKAYLDNAESFDHSRRDTVPLYVSLRGRGTSYHFDGTQFVKECCSQYFQKEPLPLFDIRKVSPIYFMDGLDELTEDVTSFDVDQLTEKDFFEHPFVLSCRSRFAEDSLVSHRFGDKLDLILRMTDWKAEHAWEYIRRFCRIRDKPDLLSDIGHAYRDSTDLAEVLHNPLLLTLFLWVIEESGMSLPLGIRDRTSVLGEVVRLLVNREMTRARPGYFPNRANIARGWQLAAWETYQARMQENDLTIAQLQELVAESEPNTAALTKSPLFLNLLDVRPHSSYVRGMIHEMLWEYLVASAIADGVKENRYPYPRCLEHVNRVEINRFVRTLWARETEAVRCEVVERLKSAFARDAVSPDPYASLRRSHTAYYIGRMALGGMESQLLALDAAESDIMVKLSIAFGLVKLGDQASEATLWQRLDADEQWDLYNRGYHLVYYRDWSAVRNPPPYIDSGVARWDRTFAALLRHLTSPEPSHAALRRIELLTMRRFVETRRCTGPVGAGEIECIRTSMQDTPELIAGFREGVQNEFQRLVRSWNAVQTK